MVLPFAAYLIGGLVIAGLGYLMAPRQKQPKPPELSDLENPTAEAGRPIPIVFGTVRVTGTNVLWYGDKAIMKRKIPVDKK